MKTILITRPKNQAQDLAQTLANHNIKTFIEPIFEVEEIKVEKLPQNFSAIIITSINACFILRKFAIPKNTLIFTIGKKTEQKIREAGFDNIILSTKNSAQSLQDQVAQYDGEILYLRGNKISFDFAQYFDKISQITVYQIKESDKFSDEFLKFCQENSPNPFDEILLFSQNSALIFFRLAKEHNLLEYFLDAKIVCLSSKIVETASSLGFSQVAIFDENPILKKFYE